MRLKSVISRRLVIVLLVFLVPAATTPALGYSVQTHEQLIDLAWNDSIRPLLLSRYPDLTEAQLDEARAYAYGGSAIQDLGYYPFGKPFFSDLTHYVRSGDFVKNLIRDASTPDQLAFAVGALAHYVGDTIGHSEAVNPSVADEFPSLRARYGPSVAYDKNPHAHVRTELAFDINEISKHRFAPSAYLDHVGLKVPGRLLDRAFFETYGLNAESVLGKRRPTIRGYRFAVRRLLPRVAYAEVVLHRGAMPPDLPGPALDELQANLASTDFEKRWNAYRRHAGIGTYMLAGLIVIVPKVGPLADLAIKGPTSTTEESYIESVNASTRALKEALIEFRQGDSKVPNRDLDTGARVKPGSYRLTDETYARLLDRITRHPGQRIPLGLKQDIANYYSDPLALIATKKHPAAWARVQAELVVLSTMSTSGLALEADLTPSSEEDD